MHRLILSHLLRRPVRSLISVVAIAAEVVLILVVVGLLLGIVSDSRQRQQGMGAEIMVQPPGTSFLMGLSGLPMPTKFAGKLSRLPHVKAVAPVGVQLNTTGGIETIYGIDLDSFLKVAGPFVYLAGGPFRNPDEIVVDDYFARSNHLAVGSSVALWSHRFRISGIVEHGKGARKYIDLAGMQRLVGAEGKASIFYLKLDDPASDTVNRVIGEIKEIPGAGDFQVRSMSEWLTLMTPANLPGFSKVVDLVIAVAVMIGFIAIFQTMYTAVLERTREIGVLKSLGLSKLGILRSVLQETLLLALAGAAAGIAASLLARVFIQNMFPTFRVLIDPGWILYSLLIALLAAILGGIYPAYQAAEKDPIEALAYE